MSDKKKTKLLRAIAKVPALNGKATEFEALLFNHDFGALIAALELQLGCTEDMDLNLYLDSYIDPPASSPATTLPPSAPATRCGAARPTTIRIPPSIVAAYKARARTHCAPYQRLMIRALRMGMAAWQTEELRPISKP